MADITLEKAKTVYKYGQPMTALHLITKGRIKVTYPGGEFFLVKGDVIGICEVCSEIHFLNYVTMEDTGILTYPLANLDSLGELLQKHPDIARLFLLSAFRQINMLLEQLALSEVTCSKYYNDLIADYNKYTNLSNRYHIPAQKLNSLNEVNTFLSQELPELWLNGYYSGLSHIYSSENYKFLVQEPTVSNGLLRKCSMDFGKIYSCMEEQYQYTKSLSSFYFNTSENDLFHFYTSLYYQLGQACPEVNSFTEDIQRMIEQYREFWEADRELYEQRIDTFRSHISQLDMRKEDSDAADSDAAIADKLTGSLNTILNFAGSDLNIASSFRQHVHSYKSLNDKSSMDSSVCALRKALTEEFYSLYSISFQRTLNIPDVQEIPAPVRMFLYFGYVDEDLAGKNNAISLYKIAEGMEDYSQFGLYTFYHWLLAIFNGHKNPSRNEFDMDYSDFIHKQKLSGTISAQELRDLEQNAMSKVNFELRNMFPVANKTTYGRLTTFCPLFCADNVLKSLDDSLVTVSGISKAIEQIKKVDYSAFYRETLDTEHSDILGKELVHMEYLPDVILMPNAGTRGVMWQEIEGKRRNSPGRMIFSIFHLEDLTTAFIRTTGEFRWDMCKRMQGSRWNDISDRSLTSEYFDYIQFYKRNHDLSADAKEKVRISLQRAKNSFKEMFVLDYIIWILFEGKGAPRLNKIARKILFTYCPFPHDVCQTLAQNPLYTELMNQHKIQTAQRLHRLNLILQKLKASGTPIPNTLEKEYAYIEGKLG